MINICILDIETARDMKSIIQIAYTFLDRETLECVYSANFLINENRGIVDCCNKISLDDIQMYGLDVRIAFHIMRLNLRYCSHIVGHNISFDMSRISSYFEELDMEFIAPKQICTMYASRKICNLTDINGRRKSPKLCELYECLFDCYPEMDKCHSADYDVEITIKCFKRLLELEVITID